MKKAYLGIDIGSISTKAVVIDENNNIIASSYLYNEENTYVTTRKVIKELKNQIDTNKYKVVGLGTTGLKRKLIGTMLGANTVKNEITAHAASTNSIYPNVKTIFEIGGKDSKIISLDKGVVTSYDMNNINSAHTGIFLSNEAKKLGITIEEFSTLALTTKKPIKIKSNCTKFSKSELMRKMQIGYKKEDIAYGLCLAAAKNYLGSFNKNINIKPPIAFEGGVSRNSGVVKALEELTGYKIYTDSNSHLMGAIGVAILSKQEKEINFSFDIENIVFNPSEPDLGQRPNNRKITSITKNKEVVDS